MIKFSIDLSQVSSLGSVNREQYQSISNAIVIRASDEVYNQIRREASRKLKSTRQEYLRNINSPVIKGSKGSITLTGMLPNMIEQGSSAFDMKKGFAKSRKIKRTKSGGWYLTIPFRHASAGAVGENSAFSSVMPKAVYNLARKLKPNKTAFGGRSSGGGTFGKAELKRTGHGIIRTRPEINSNGGGLSAKQKSAYKHKSSIYSGMRRNQKTYQTSTSGSYVTFRRVGSGSASNSWIHKGMKANNFMTKALKNLDVNSVTSAVVDEQLTQMGL